jgi:hypothetical protein
MEVYTIEYHSSLTEPPPASSGRKRKIDPSPQKNVLSHSPAKITAQSRSGHDEEGKPRDWIVQHDAPYATNSSPVAIVETSDLSTVSQAAFSARHVDVGFTIYSVNDPRNLYIQGAIKSTLQPFGRQRHRTALGASAAPLSREDTSAPTMAVDNRWCFRPFYN